MLHEVKVFSALAVRSSFDNGMFSCIEKQGIRSTIEWDPTAVIEKRIQNGDTADLVIVTDGAMKKFVDSGFISSGHCFPLVDSVIGLSVKKGEPHPDISSADKCLDALLSSRSVAYSLGGASGIYMQELWRKFGHLERINRRATIIDKGFTGEKLISGEAEIAIQQISELIVVDGIEVIGPLPDELQQVTSISMAISNSSLNNAAAHELASLLTSQTAKEIYERNGLKFRGN